MRTGLSDPTYAKAANPAPSSAYNPDEKASDPNRQVRASDATFVSEDFPDVKVVLDKDGDVQVSQGGDIIVLDKATALKVGNHLRWLATADEAAR